MAFIGWVAIVFVALLLLGVTFAIHPLLGLAVLIVGGIWGVSAMQEGKAAKERGQEQARKADADRIAQIEEQKLDLERERLFMAEAEQRSAIRRSAMTPGERTSDDEGSRLTQSLSNEIDVFVDANIIRHHGTLDKLRGEKVVCENGHVTTYGKMESRGGGFGCSDCKSERYAFVAEGANQYQFCPNRVRQKSSFDREGKEWAFLHSVAANQIECPVCAWATQNGMKLQPHGFTLRERSLLPIHAAS